MNYHTVPCATCATTTKRELRRVNESAKQQWKTYCSLICQRTARNKQRAILCNQPSCNNFLQRSQDQTDKKKKFYCSHSCAAIINNQERALRKPKNYCRNQSCGIVIPSRNIYCSVKCQRSLNRVTKEEYARRTLNTIKTFFEKTGRIPFKKELWKIYKPARIAFGSWNHAIVAAGFTPNPVMFAKKHLAKDGHPCDSFAEKIIDDWLYEHHISHERKIPYGENKMTADFRVDNTIIEFLGLHGQHHRYDQLVKEKQKIWKEKNLNVIALYPHDIIPIEKLSQRLQIFVS
ncbi:MAG: hypothetical protein HY437_02205 [Candidatus Magasanikbacteria bacterium]|nr:hypothetical protein [Candidatus Magasanikbacteria bacterium]